VEILVIGSGSDGNSTLIKGRTATILIDIGIGPKTFKRRLALRDINDLKLDGVFITHEHGDHVGKLHKLLCNYDVKYYINEKSYLNMPTEVYNEVKNKTHEFINPFGKVFINDMELSFIPLSHDTRECLGIIIKEDDKKVVYIADTGYVDSEYKDLLKDANCYMFEANHDPQMEMNSNRNQDLKNRVLGDRGHLSNEDSAVYLSYLITKRTKNIVFLHRSRDCNSLDVLKETVFSVFDAYSVDTSNIEFDYADQDNPTRIIEV